jgi:hypothetical protein
MTWAEITDWFSSFMEIVHTRGVKEGFIAGLAIGFVLPVGILILIKLARYRKRRCREIVIQGQDGELHISVSAVREFVRRILAEFGEADLKSVSLRQRGPRKIINVSLNAVPGTDLVNLQASVAARIKTEAGKKLGLDENLGKVNIWVYEYTADERKIAKRTRKLKSEAELNAPEEINAPENDDGATPENSDNAPENNDGATPESDNAPENNDALKLKEPVSLAFPTNK